MRRRLRFASVAFAAALTLAGCAGGSSSGTSAGFNLVNAGTLTVSPYSASPPAITIDAAGKLGGLIGDVINGFAAKHQLKVKTTQTTFASSLLYVQQGRSDMTPFIYYTDQRAKSVYYTASLFQLPAAMITKNSFPFTGPDSMKGKKVGAVVGEVWGSYLQASLGGDVQLFQKDAEAAQALLNGQIDGYVNSSLQLYNPPLAGQDDLIAHPLKAGDFTLPPSTITNVAYNVVSCRNPKLGSAFDEYLKEIAASGQLKTFYQKNGFPENFQLQAPTTPQKGC